MVTRSDRSVLFDLKAAVDRELEVDRSMAKASCFLRREHLLGEKRAILEEQQALTRVLNMRGVTLSEVRSFCFGD